MRIPFVASPNHRQTDRRKITAIVVHYTGTLSQESAVDWMKNPASRISTHYLVSRTGEILQMVREEDIAWHAGRSAMFPNTTPPREPHVDTFSIGITLVGTADSGFTDKQMAALYLLIELLVSRHKIPPDRIVGHKHIAPGRHADPDGYIDQFNWRRVHEIASNALTS